jgi:phosphoribosylformylglycinamidine (FGAM) synthase PurS component
VELTVEAPDEEAARARVEEVARRLLSNPVIEDHRILRAEEVPGPDAAEPGRGAA